MNKNKSDTNKKKKGSQLVIRVDKHERDDFVSLCDALDTSAAREIRRFMREWVAAHKARDTASAAEERTEERTEVTPPAKAGQGEQSAREAESSVDESLNETSKETLKELAATPVGVAKRKKKP